MPRVHFAYDLEKDIWNALRVINEPSHHDPREDVSWMFGRLPAEFVAEMRGLGAADEQRTKIAAHLKGEHENVRELIEQRIKLFSEKWMMVNNAYFEKIEHIFPGAFSAGETFTAYLTNLGSCPFNIKEGWFMAKLGDTGADAVVAHELLHFAFIRKYWRQCKEVLKLSAKEFWDIQEATTFLLNEEMPGMFSRPDRGYPEHQKLRALLVDEWRAHKNFDSLLAHYATIKNSCKK